MSKITLFFLGIFLLFTFSAYAAEPIGTVIAIYGEASVINSAGRSPLALKDTLMESDTVATASNSKVQILLRDGSAISLGGETELELKEFSDIGTSPNFTADFVKGSLRVITGKITEANPEGFKITTPHSTLGIRGTILSLRTDDDGTTLMVLNSDKTVLFNNVAVSENQKAVARQGGKPVITAITSQEKEAEIREMIVAPAASSAISFYRPFTDIPDIQYSAAIATLTGTVDTGTFSFDVNVLNGTISSANTSGGYFSGSYGGTVHWELNGGSGKFSTERGFEVRNFGGSIEDRTMPPNPGRDKYEMDRLNTHLTLKLENNSTLTGDLNLRLHDPSVPGSGDTIIIPANGKM
jgi:hypothetical protein